METRPAREKIILALDVAGEDEAVELVNTLKSYVGIFKVGIELLNATGIGIIKRIIKMGGQVFLDGKFNDIPNTVQGACRAATKLGVKMLNVHTMGGSEMMKVAAESVADEASKLGIEKPLLLGVTILTSINKEIMNRELKIVGDVVDQVIHLARLASDSGLDGVIASPQEIKYIRRDIPGKMLIVTPGVRPEWASSQDQKRIMTPKEAILNGASYLVIGRPIMKPPRHIGNPIDAANLITEEIRVANKTGEENDVH